MLKTEPPARLCEAVHVVAARDALLGSEITRLLIERYLSEPPAGMQSASRSDELTSREQEVLLDLGNVGDRMDNGELHPGAGDSDGLPECVWTEHGG